MPRHITHNRENDGVDRRGFLECMAWAGTGVIWTLAGGIARSQKLGDPPSAGAGLSFVQISDSHIGFNKDANPDVTATLQTAVDRINALPERPAFLIHTGDITQLSKPAEFDTADSILQTIKTGERFFVPGEHDVVAPRVYLDRYGKKSKGDGWFSFDSGGAHFVGLSNVMHFNGGLGSLGHDQLEWLEDDLEAQSDSTPIVVFAHIPLWTVYPQWGWGTDDSAQALTYLRRFGSVTVLNGHIHQVMQKVEGNITFHTACSTAFPQPKPGAAPAPGPMKVPAEELRANLGLTSVRYVQGQGALALVDATLG
jgi:3',5'-cyclic AMP phosphodiesterase CpdA